MGKNYMTSKKEIEDAFQLVINKFDDPKLKPRFATYSKNMQFTFPDINSTYLIKVLNGKVESLKEENIDSPDIHVTIESGVFIDILNKKINPMKAYTTGKLKAKGKLTDLLKLQKLL
jgi:putative sterol carrier protein